MYIFSFILSIVAFLFCWLSFWSIPLSIAALIIAIVMFSKYFIGENKEKYTKGKSLVFSAFVLSILSTLGSMIMTGVPVGMVLINSISLAQ